jgi:two-component system, chemotaxis family, response regulator WspF
MRVAIAHRDPLVREALRRCLSDGGLSLIWSVPDGQELTRMRRRDPPDLLLVDADLVGPSGAAISVVDSSAGACLVLADDDASQGVYEALSAGALGHVVPPRLDGDGELLGSARLLTRIRRLEGLIGNARPAQPLPDSGDANALPIIALGASAGGPPALAKVLSGLPAGLAAAVLIVQHIDAEFSAGLVEWLGSNSMLPVQLAHAGVSILPGRVYVGSTEGHLVLLPSQQLAYRGPSASDLHVPSVDALFCSLVAHGRKGAAALLSGMGDDGARGLLRLRQAGWYTVAQDESSCAVYGMPRVATETGAAAQSLPLAAIGAALARHVLQH